MAYPHAYFRKKPFDGPPGPTVERWLVEEWPGCFCVNRTVDGAGEWEPLRKQEWERVFRDPVTQQWRAY